MFIKKADVINEYVIILTTVSLAFAAMNTYLKRSFQAKTKDLTDTLIADFHLNQINEGESIVKRVNNSTLTKKEDLGGVKTVIQKNNAEIGALFISYDPFKQISGYSDNPGGKAISPPPYPEDKLSYPQPKDNPQNP